MASEVLKARNEFINTLASIAAPLIQLVVVTTVALTDQLGLSSLFADSSLLPIVNIITIFVIISWLVYYNSKAASVTSRAYEKIKFQYVILEVLLGIFLLISFIYPSVFNEHIVLLQYITYSSFIIVSGGIIYTGIQTYFAKKLIQSEDDYYPKILKMFTDQGVIPAKRVRVITIIDDPNNLYRNKLIKVAVNNIKYVLKTDYNVKQVLSMWKNDEIPKSILEVLDKQQTGNS